MLVFLLSLVFNCNGMLCSTKAQIECGMKTVESFRDRKSRCATEETERGCKPDECQDEYLWQATATDLCKCIGLHFSQVTWGWVPFSVVCVYNGWSITIPSELMALLAD